MQLAIVKTNPAAKRATNIERVLDNVSAIKLGLVWCKRNGHDVIDASVTGSRPVIVIETSARCAALVQDGHAAEVGSQVVNGIHTRVMCVVQCGCEIKWIERGN